MSPSKARSLFLFETQTNLDQASLPYNEKWQDATIGWLVRDRNFYLAGKDRIQPDWFVDPYCGKVWKIMLDFQARFNRQPTIDEFRASQALMQLDQGDRNRVLAKIEIGIAASRDIGLDVIRDDLTLWLKTQVLKIGVERVSTTYNGAVRDRKKFAESFSIFKQCATDMDRASFEPDADMSWDDVANGDFINQMLAERERAMTFGCPKLDQKLLPDCINNRSLLLGDHTVILAPTNRGKCFGIDTPVIMHDGTIKRVQDVVIGDHLMGPDGSPRIVLGTTRGRGEMYRVTPNVGGDPFVCNGPHVLNLRFGHSSHYGQTINISAEDFIKTSKDYQRAARLWHAAVPFQQQELPVHPYILGLWLGDGHSDRAAVTTMDTEIASVWTEWIEAQGDVAVSFKNTLENRASTIAAQCAVGQIRVRSNMILRDMGLLNNKHIPQTYLTASRDQRLLLLAGLLDTDGSWAHGNGTQSQFEITQKNTALADAILFLARSLGFKTAIDHVRKGCQTGVVGDYWRICIRGRLSQIPTRLKRKQAVDSKKPEATTGFRIEAIGEDDYYGFEVNEDHLFLLGDFTVTHNSTSMLSVIRANLITGSGDVLFLSHEGVPHDLKRKILMGLLDVNKDELIALSETEEGQKRLLAAQKYLKRHLVYKPMNKAGLTVEEVETAIRLAVEKHSAETGRRFGLIVDDYPWNLTTTLAVRGHWARREIGSHVYKIFTQLALELDAHVLSAIQTNREGSKIGRRQRGADDRMLQMEDVMEVFEAMTTATNVISLNRDAIAEAGNRQTYHVCKSRSNETGWCVLTRTNYGHATAHAPNLDATFYRGTHNLTGGEIDGLLSQYAGQSLPQTYYDL